MIGAFLGALLIDLLAEQPLPLGGISEFWRDAILGMLILLAVAIDYVVFGRLKNLWARVGLQVSADKPARNRR